MKLSRLASVLVTFLLAVLVVGGVDCLVHGGARPLRAAEGWHARLDDGLAAAKRTGRPLLVVTIWKDGLCASCDAWRQRVAADEGFRRELRRFEPVEWLYDGLGGAVIRWTLANGGKSDDPAAQLFAVGTDGKVLSRLEDAKAHTPASVVAWMKAQADAWDRDHPRTALPFVRAEVVTAPDGGAAPPRCAEVEAAREARVPVLLYVGRDGGATDGATDDATKAELAASRRLEKSVLDSKQAAAAAKGWALVRLDVADPAHREYAKSLRVERVPALLVLDPASGEWTALATTITAADLAYRLRKHAPAAAAGDRR